MHGRVFLAGAAGAIGCRLAPLLIGAGYEVFGTTRSAARTARLEAVGVRPVIVDAYDGAALLQAMVAARPETVIHQLTDLAGLDPNRRAEFLARNARLRIEGTQNLIAAAVTAGAGRVIAQSIAWMYAPGPEPHSEGDALDLDAEDARKITVEGVVALERSVTASPALVAAVLRYGQLYGPGTGRDEPFGSAPVHVDAAASAALLALQRAAAGIFNVAEESAYVSSAKARRELGWDPAFRLRDIRG